MEKIKNRRTEIICTIGPACRSLKKLVALIEAGMDVARLHFSYADHAEHAESIKRIRKAEQIAQRKVAILQDLSGSKVRMMDFTNDIAELTEGKEFILTANQIKGDASKVSLNIPELISVVKPGDIVLLADGALKLQAITVNKTHVRCKIIVGGRVKSRQAVHVLGKAAPVCVPSDKDLKDVMFGISQGVDWIAQSYAVSPEEINELRTFIRNQGAEIPIIAKIERRAAIDNLNTIIQAADAVMVARGDLGLDIPIEQIALAQKHIIQHANSSCKPVITATEMLFSMMKQPRPTRADVTDITNAILDGSDAVMLSGETGMGKYPIEATKTMAQIAIVADDYRKQMASAASFCG